MKARLFSLWLLLSVAVGLSAYDFKADGLCYNIIDRNSHTVEVTYDGTYKTLTTANIPKKAYYRGFDYNVTGIGYNAFRGCTSLTSVTIPNSVTSIGSRAFSGCTGLTYIIIPNSVTNIAYGTFEGCIGLTSIIVERGNPTYDSRDGCNAIIETTSNTLISGCKTTIIPNSVTSIGDDAFLGCSGLTSITIGNSVTSIGDDAFLGCSGLTSITIGNSVTSIGDYTFRGCTGLTSITIPNSITDIGMYAFSGCSGLTSITIPNSVTSIEESAFSGCSGLTSITIPNDLTSIGEEAFRDCSGLTSITIPNSVTDIGMYTFSGCAGLTSITIPDSVTDIGNYAFSDCTGLTSVTIGNSVTSIKYYAFDGCTNLTTITWNAAKYSGSTQFLTTDLCSQITSFVFGDNVQYIPEFSYSSMKNLTSITIGNSITSIRKNTFWGCAGLTSITIGNSVTSIGDYAFRDCTGLTSIAIPNSVTSIGESAFRYCSGLTSVTIGNSVTSIGSRAFSGCTGLTSIAIPNSVTYLSGFDGCTGLTSVTIPNSVTSIGESAFRYCSGLTSVTIGNSVTSIGSRAFSGCTGLTSVTIPNSVTSIGVAAFKECTSITSVVWNAKNCSDFSIYDTPFYYEGYYSSDDFDLRPQITSFVLGDSVQYIPNYLLNGLKNITSITIPSSVTSIGDYAFKGSSITSVVWNPKNYNGFSLGDTPFYHYDGHNNKIDFDLRPQITSFIFGDNVQYIPDYLCSGLRNLPSINIPNSVTGIGEDAFRDCIGLTSVTIGNSVTSIESGAFGDCTGLTSITIPNSVTYLSGFNGCTGLTSVTIPNSVTYLSGFNGCTGLTSVTIPNSVTYLSGFNGCTGLTSINIPNSVTSIGSGAFSGCTGLTSITIPDNVTSIGNSAFNYCTSLTSISIGNSVTSIGDYAFDDCTGLTSVIWNAKACSDFEWNNTPFYHNEYDSWKQYLNFDVRPQITSFVFGDSVQYIPDYLCAGMVNLTSTNIPKNVTNIGEGAFKDCSNLKTISIKTYYPPKLETTEMDSWEFPFNGVKKHINIYIPCGAGYNFRWKQDWRYFEGNSYVETPLHHKITAQPQDSTLGIVKIVQANTCDNDTTIIVAEANEHYRFAQWNDGNTDNPRKVVVVGDTTYIAEFVLLTNHTIIGTCNSIQGSVTGGGTYQYGDIVTLTAIPNTGYAFTQWRDGNKDNPRKVTVTADATYTAEFALQNYVVSATCDPQHGQVTGGGTYPYGSEVTLTATANEGYAFTQWSDGNKDNPRKVTVTADATYTAEFALQNYVVSATCDPQHGQVTGSGTYSYGSEVTLTATANEGYAFTQWRDGNKDNPRKVTVTADATYTAEFALQNYVVSATCDPQHGQVTGGGTYPYGSEVTLTATANEGYAFTQWSDGNKDNPRKVTVTADATYTAEFALQNYVVSATCDPQHGQVTGGGTYPYGSEVTLTAVPHDGYEFKQWSDGSIANPYSFSVEKDVNIKALFEPTTPVENVVAEENNTPRKVFRNGQVLILRNGRTYTLTGEEVE